METLKENFIGFSLTGLDLVLIIHNLILLTHLV